MLENEGDSATSTNIYFSNAGRFCRLKKEVKIQPLPTFLTAGFFIEKAKI